jgi:hypothetical protein
MAPSSRSSLLLLVLLALLGPVTGQKAAENAYWSRNAFFLELGGKAWAYSLNYERRVVLSPMVRLGIQAGLGINLIEDPPDFMHGGNLLLPFSLNWMIGKSENQFEAGFGTTVQGTSSFKFGQINYPTLGDKVKAIGFLHLGYRYHPPLGGLVFRVGYTPMFRYLNFFPPGGKHIQHWAGISIGIAPKNVNIQ